MIRFPACFTELAETMAERTGGSATEGGKKQRLSGKTRSLTRISQTNFAESPLVKPSRQSTKFSHRKEEGE